MTEPPRALNAKSTDVLIKVMSRAQTWLYKKTGGRFADRFLRGAAMGHRVILVASSGGRDRHPPWYLNLQANPEVTFRIRREVLSLVARDATEAERDEYWPKLDAMYPDFANYRSYTGRVIPIVICDPA